MRLLRSSKSTWTELLRCLSGIVTVAFNLNRHAPFLEQPFRYIAPVSVAHTPPLQFKRRDIHFRSEAQMPDYHFKLGCSCRNRCSGEVSKSPLERSIFATMTFAGNPEVTKSNTCSLFIGFPVRMLPFCGWFVNAGLCDLSKRSGTSPARAARRTSTRTWEGHTCEYDCVGMGRRSAQAGLRSSSPLRQAALGRCAVRFR